MGKSTEVSTAIQDLKESDVYRVEAHRPAPLRRCDECNRQAIAIVGFAADAEGDQRVCQYHAKELLEVA